MTDFQRIYPVVLFTALIVASGLVNGCTSPAKSSATVQQSTSLPGAIGSNGSVDRVEVYHFHGDQQCVSCIAVGDLAEKTVNDNFKAELSSGRVVFAHINYDLPENAALTAKYGVTGSSLWLGIYDSNGFHRQQIMDVWYLTGDKEKYKAYLTSVIARRLNGDLS
jgi:hypothetical protein